MVNYLNLEFMRLAWREMKVEYSKFTRTRHILKAILIDKKIAKEVSSTTKQALSMES